MASMYPTLLKRILLPLHNAARGRNYVRRRRLLDRSQWWSSEQLREFQWTELLRLLKVAFATPYYARKYASVGAVFEDIRSWDDFNRLPILTRAEIQEHLEELSPPNVRAKRLPHSTGGSSGVPLRFYRTIESYDWRLAATHRAYEWSGFAPGEKSLHLWGAPVGVPSRLAAFKKAAYDTLYGQTIISTFVQTDEVWKNVFAETMARKPSYIVGYASSLLAFARWLDSSNVPIWRPKAILSAADQLDANARSFIEEKLRAPVFNTYGSREFMSIGAECEKHEGFHINGENLVVQTVSSARSASEVLITDLHNHGTIFIRYVIGDLGVLSEHPCSCGRGLPLLGAIEGRSIDTITLGSGRAISSLFFRHILKEIPEIVEYQVRQVSLNHVVVVAVLTKPLSDRSNAVFQFEMRRALGEGAVSVQPVNSIPRAANGKLRAIVPMASHDTRRAAAGS